MSTQALRRSHTATSFEPLTLLSALAAVTERIGLIATASTTFDEPYHVARRFASLDHLSGGRAGWNLVTTANPDAALNFGLEEHVEHGERYRRGREFFDVVTGLWDSWADDAFVRDVESGTFFDPARMHVLNHKGENLSVRGPLNIARPVQGWPVIVQAGSSEAGRQIAAETAEAVFTAQTTLADGQRFYADIKGRMANSGEIPSISRFCPQRSSWSATRWTMHWKSGRVSIAWFITTVVSPRSRSCWVTMSLASIPTGRYLRYLKPTQAKAAASG